MRCSLSAQATARSRKGKYSLEGNQPEVLLRTVTTVWRTKPGSTLVNGFKGATGKSAYFRYPGSYQFAPKSRFLASPGAARSSSASMDPPPRGPPLVMDNLNIHCRKTLTDYFGEQEGGYLWDRLTVHHTPTHGSWLNQAEIEISLFARQCLGRRRISSLAVLERESRAWNRQINRDRVKINWRFTRENARVKFRYMNNYFRRSKT